MLTFTIKTADSSRELLAESRFVVEDNGQIITDLALADVHDLLCSIEDLARSNDILRAEVERLAKA
jgi:hypothetical protein